MTWRSVSRGVTINWAGIMKWGGPFPYEDGAMKNHSWEGSGRSELSRTSQSETQIRLLLSVSNRPREPRPHVVLLDRPILDELLQVIKRRISRAVDLIDNGACRDD